MHVELEVTAQSSPPEQPEAWTYHGAGGPLNVQLMVNGDAEWLTVKNPGMHKIIENCHN